METTTIKMHAHGFLAVYVQSFEKEKDFLDATDDKYFLKKDIATRRKLLKEIYQAGQAMLPVKEKKISKIDKPVKNKPKKTVSKT